MKKVWEALCAAIKKIAEIGAGAASMGISYEPRMPAKLRKKS